MKRDFIGNMKKWYFFEATTTAQTAHLLFRPFHRYCNSNIPYTLTHTHTHSLSHTHTHTQQYLSISLSHTHTHTQQYLSISLSHTHTHTIFLTVICSTSILSMLYLHTRTHINTHTQTHTHTHTHTRNNTSTIMFCTIHYTEGISRKRSCEQTKWNWGNIFQVL